MVSAYNLIAPAIAALVCLAAFFKGERPEQWGAAIIGVAWLVPISFYIFHIFHPKPQVLELILLGLDGALAFSLLALSLRFVKLWLGTAMMIQSVELALHGAAMTDAGLGFQPYLVFNNVASLSLIAILAWATAAAWWRRHAASRRLARAASGSAGAREGRAAAA